MFDHLQKDKSLYIQKRYPVTDAEFEVLDEKYGKLCWFAASKLASANRKSEEDLQDFHSEILIGMFRAGSYYKRQTFIESTFKYLDKSRVFMSSEDLADLNLLQKMWYQRKAYFTEIHEVLIREVLGKYTDALEEKTPSDKEPLEFNPANQKTYVNANGETKKVNPFEVYCKAIIWNTKKSLGQAISKENEHKCKEVSLDEWNFLEGGDSSRMMGEGISYTTNYIQSDFRAIRDQLAGLEDKRPLTTFDIIMDPINHDSVFKQKQGKKDGIKINVVRKKTNMSYRTINKQLKTIKNVIEKEMGM